MEIYTIEYVENTWNMKTVAEPPRKRNSDVTNNLLTIRLLVMSDQKNG